MSVLTLYVDEVMRTLSNDGQYPFVVKDKTVDIVRFALNTGFTDVVLDEYSALRVMYQRPGEAEVRAQTLTYYDTDGLHNYYDWHLLSTDLAEKGTLTVALCILRTDGDVEEWHTTPCQVRVLDTIHTDDSDEADESITPTVAERVAVLETMIQRVASGAPIVVSSTSAMTDTDQIYVLSTDGNWYYHNGSAWVAGGEYGAVATDTTLSQVGLPADAGAVGDALIELNGCLEELGTDIGFDLIKSAEESVGYYFTNNTGRKALDSNAEAYGTTLYGLIPVAPGETYKLTVGIPQTTNYWFAYGFYTGNGWGSDYFDATTNRTTITKPGELIDGLYTTSVDVTVPEGDTYFAVSYRAFTGGKVSFIRANSESLRNEISAVKSDVADLGNTVLKHADNQFMFGSYKDFYYEADGTDLYVKCTGSWHLRGKVHDTRNYTTILLNNRATSPLGVEDCILLPVNYGIAFNTITSEYDYVYNRTPAYNEVIVFMNGGGYISGGIGQQVYNAKRDYLTELEVKAASDSIASDHAIYEVPSYFESQLATKLAKIQTDINGGKEDGATQDTEAFIFITDVHWANNKKHSPALIKRILDSTSISTVICGGDLIYSHNATKAGAVSEIKGFIDLVKACAKEYFGVFGNHDDNSNSGAAAAIKFGKEEQYNLLYPQSNMGNVHWAFEESNELVRPYRNDYYVDHPHTKTRFLCLDWNYGDLTARKVWVTSVLSKNDGYRVVVIYHGFYANDGEEALAEEHITFLPTFEPYKNKIVGMFTGHVHFDDVVNYFDSNKAPIIITSCDAFRAAIGMTADTVTEQCFDVVVINYTTSKIHMTRIGFGQDRSVDFSLA